MWATGCACHGQNGLASSAHAIDSANQPARSAACIVDGAGSHSIIVTHTGDIAYEFVFGLTLSNTYSIDTGPGEFVWVVH